jgi:hypothetical protein
LDAGYLIKIHENWHKKMKLPPNGTKNCAYIKQLEKLPGVFYEIEN